MPSSRRSTSLLCLAFGAALACACSNLDVQQPSEAPPGSSSSSSGGGGQDATASSSQNSSAASTGTGVGPKACSGYATRYWDCCKAHCGWTDNTPITVNPVTSCNQSNVPQSSQPGLASSCQVPGTDSSYTCFEMRPWAVSDTLSYGFASVPSSGGDVCGRCYRIEFTGQGHYHPADQGSQRLANKTMIVQATNMASDVQGNQFDLLIPGGGVGKFDVDACGAQWGATADQMGEPYGGILSQCRKNTPGATLDIDKQCVQTGCAALFNKPSLKPLLDGCTWFVDWFEAADNPAIRYEEVECPDALVQASGMDRRPLGDINPRCN